MPQTIALIATYIVTALNSAGVIAVITPGTLFWANVAVAIAVAGVLIGTSILLTPTLKLNPNQQRTPIKQPIAPRRRYYGQVMASGVFSFLKAKGAYLYEVLMIASQRIYRIEEYWLTDRTVYVNPAGDVLYSIRIGDTPAPLPHDYNQFTNDFHYVHIETRLGGADDTAYSDLVANFPEYTNSCRLTGIFTGYMRLRSAATDFFNYYPSGPWKLRFTFKAALIWDPRDATQDRYDPLTWKWSDNGALIILDYLRHADGARLPEFLFDEVIDDWMQQADICDEIVPLLVVQNGGPTEAEIVAQIQSGLLAWQAVLPGNQELILFMIAQYPSVYSLADILFQLQVNRRTTTNPENTAFLDPIIATASQVPAPVAVSSEKRYRLSGGYEFIAAPRDVLPQMLEPMGAHLRMLSNGNIVLRVFGCVQNEPDVIFGDDDIIAYTMRRGAEKSDLRNEIRAHYTPRGGQYVEQESEPWVNQDSVDLNGLQSTTLDLSWCPSHGQARRRQKLEAYRLDPAWSGEILTNASGLDALGETFIRVRIAELGINEIFEKLSFSAEIETGQCRMQIRSLPAEAFTWDPTTEEGRNPSQFPVASGTANQTPTPDHLWATSYTVAGIQTLVVGVDGFDDRPDLRFYAQAMPPGGVFQDMVVTYPNKFGTMSPVALGVWTVRARFIPNSGLPSAFVSLTIQVTAGVSQVLPAGDLQLTSSAPIVV